MLDKQTDAMKEYCAISRSEGSLDRMKSLPPVLWLCSRGAAGRACFEHEDKNSDETPTGRPVFLNPQLFEFMATSRGTENPPSPRYRPYKAVASVGPDSFPSTIRWKVRCRRRPKDSKARLAAYVGPTSEVTRSVRWPLSPFSLLSRLAPCPKPSGR